MSSISTPPPPLRLLPTPGGVFDAPPPSVIPYKEETIRYVKAVSPTWRCGFVGEDLVIVIPQDQIALGLSREKYVCLLEYAEDVLGVKRILAVFEKPNLKTTEGFPRVLLHVGFRVLSPELHPEKLNAADYFVMVYKV